MTKENEKTGKKKQRIREATTEDLEKILDTEFKKGKLKIVLGRKTKVPALIYKKTFNKERQTGLLHGEPLTPETFIKECNKKGYVLATDGKYARVWTSNYFTEKTGLTTNAKPHKRKKPTLEELKDQARKMGLKKYTKKHSKKSLAASIRRALKKKGKKKVKKVKEETPVETKPSKKHKEEAPEEKKPPKKHKKEATSDEKPSKMDKEEVPADKSKKPEEKFAKLKGATEEATKDE